MAEPGCSAARRRLSAWIDGELDTAERRAVDAHLAGCQDCRAALDGLLALERTLRAAPPAPLPPDLADTVLARLPVAALRNQALLRAARRPPEVPAAAALAHISLALTAGAGLVAAAILYRWGWQTVVAWLQAAGSLLAAQGQALGWRVWAGVAWPASLPGEWARAGAGWWWRLQTLVMDTGALVGRWLAEHPWWVLAALGLTGTVLWACARLWGHQVRMFAEE